MYWTLELASYLSDAPWPATKDELIDYAIRAGAPLEVVENLQSIEDEGEIYESMEEIFKNFVPVIARSCQTINSFSLDQIESNGTLFNMYIGSTI